MTNGTGRRPIQYNACRASTVHAERVPTFSKIWNARRLMVLLSSLREGRFLATADIEIFERRVLTVLNVNFAFVRDSEGGH